MTDVDTSGDLSLDLLEQARRTLAEEGFVVLQNAVPADAVRVAARRLNMAIRHQGLTTDEIAEWQMTGFFPHLRWEPEVWGVLPPVAPDLLGWQEGDQWGDPQLLLRFPDEEQDWQLEPHVDQLPPWASDRSYRGIVGVALSTAGAEDGVACVWPRSHLGEDHPMTPVPLAAGDALVMHPDLGHTGTLNLGPSVRMAIYFRLIADIGATSASAVNYVVPIAAVLVGVVFLGEAVTWNVVTGGLIVLLGMAYAENRLSPRPMAARP